MQGNAEEREMKIVTYNVNGLKQRISQHGSLLKLLNSLQADIICFQETKLSRDEVTADLIMAEGYESFFSCTCTSGKGRTGYSGVATFCHVKSAFSSTEVALPVAAEEGFTGLLENSRRENAMKKDFLFEVPKKVEGLEEITNEDLIKVDSEGRCIITDHGHFVLFNIYGPRAGCDDTERINFKLSFYKILKKRWESFLKQGRRVFVVGDLNIAPAAIDRCEAGPDFDKDQFRKWFRSLLVEHGGPFFDVFRAKHPERKDAYTCWPVHNGAEEFNFGSRIDHILIAGPCIHQNNVIQGHNFLVCHVNECDILTQFKRWKPENIPRWKGGRSVKLEGSDHAPVYVSLREIPDLPVHSTPSLAARYVPKVHGFQQTIATFLSKRKLATQVKNHEVLQLSDEDVMAECCNNSAKISFPDCSTSDSLSVESIASPNHKHVDVRSSAVANVAVEKNAMAKLRRETMKSIPSSCTKTNKKAKHNATQRTLGLYFQKKPNLSVDIDGPGTGISESTFLMSEPNSTKESFVGNDENNDLQKNEFNMNQSSRDQCDLNASCSSEKEKHNAALFEWKRIQQLMHKHNSVPLCKGHDEPCVSRLVKKEGPNFGRKFFVCSRAEGPSSNPEARCDYFKWAASKSGQKER